MDSIKTAKKHLADAMMAMSRLVPHMDPSASGDLLNAARSLTATHQQLNLISAAAKEALTVRILRNKLRPRDES